MKVQNIQDMEAVLCDMLEKVSTDPKRCVQAKEVANVCGKLLNAQKVSIDYSKMTNVPVVLPFMTRTPKA